MPAVQIVLKLVLLNSSNLLHKEQPARHFLAPIPGKEPVAKLTMGRPQAIASMTALGQAALISAGKNRCALRSKVGISVKGTIPNQCTSTFAEMVCFQHVCGCAAGNYQFDRFMTLFRHAFRKTIGIK